jgi:glucose-1-phosphate adenylyltransferase
MHAVDDVVLAGKLTGQKRAQLDKKRVHMKDVATIILGGGQGTRLFPLTMSRCKPALCYGGRYRLIDIPISNAIHSGCRQMFVITQFLSSSLHRHLLSTYRFGTASNATIELLSTEEKPANKVWFQGTADAVRQNLSYFEDTHAEYFLILSGDQLYHMDFNQLLDCAKETDADMVIASLLVDSESAKRLGVMKVGPEQLITDFYEKPQSPEALKKMRLSKSQADRLGATQGDSQSHLASMGIYLFKRQALIDILQNDSREDFGKHLIPTLIEKGNVAAYLHRGYWEDIGTVESFYLANMALTSSFPLFDCYREQWPIFTKPVTLPGAKVLNGKIDRSILCEGSTLGEVEISDSIIGPRTLIKSGTVIRDTYVMGNEFFAPPQGHSRLPERLYIGQDTVIERAIIDRHVRIGDRVRLINQAGHSHYDSENVYIRDGVIVVPYGASIPDDFVL